MKLTKKYIRVHYKLIKKLFSKTPKSLPYYFLTFIILYCASFGIYSSWKQYQYLKQSTFKAWQNQQQKFNDRNIASISDICSNPNDLSVLQKEVYELEATYETGHNLKGSWNGINLENLPAIQAQILTQFGHLIGNQKNISNFKNCHDIICIFNRVYGDTDPTIGHMVYFWYLKTGSMLSLSNTLPTQESSNPGLYDGKIFALEDYLFTKSEIQNFYQLAKSLPSIFFNIPLIKSFHKVPNGTPLELKTHPTGCSYSTSNGEILFSSQCLAKDEFQVNVTHEIAKFIDIFKGNKITKKSLSATKKWRELSLWIKEDYWNPKLSEYKFKWLTHLSPEQRVSHKAVLSPSEQLAELLAFYRFRPHDFYQRTPADLINYVSTNFFKGKSFEPKGLLNQFLNLSIKTWDHEEDQLWKKCFDLHIGPDNQVNFKNLRDIASTIHNPLFECVEKEISAFIDTTIVNLKESNTEGCNFFQSADYSYYSKEYNESLQKYVQEKVIQRKLELKEFGNQVVTSQAIKMEFKDSFDPSTIYINCYGENSHRECYYNNLNKLATLATDNHKNVKGYYKKLLIKELTELYKFEDVMEQTNHIAQKFLAPFNFRVNHTAKMLWNSCLENSNKYSDTIQLPLKFTGGRHFVKSSLLNCINDKLQDGLQSIVDASAFQIINDKKMDFNLNVNEKKFALDFLELRFTHALREILKKQRILESNYIASYFNKIAKEALESLEHSSSIFKNAFTVQHIQAQCVQALEDFYPNDYFYYSKAELDRNQGRSICSTYLNTPESKRKIQISVERSWERNLDLVDKWFMDEYKIAVGICRENYKSDNKVNNKITRMLKICIENAYVTATKYAMDNWKTDKTHYHFASREQEINSRFQSRAPVLQQKALNNQIHPGHLFFIKKWFFKLF